MARPDDLGQLQPEEWRHLLEQVARLEQALEEGQALDLTTLLPPPGSPTRLVYLYELVKTELEILYLQNRGQPLEAYLKRYPELGSLRDLSPALICEEFRARQYADRPSLLSYQERFPRQFSELLRLVNKFDPVPGRKTRAVPEGTGRMNPTLPVLPEKGKRALPQTGEYLLKAGPGFRLVEVLGRGSFGDVYRAFDADGQLVAVKWLSRTMDSEACRRELETLQTLSRLEHPHLLRTREYHEHKGRLVLVMDLAEGSLKDRMEECRKKGLPGIPVAELLTYFRQVADALDFLHAHKVTHRDIKPENVLLAQGRALLADFGLAREQDDSTILTSQVCGTPVYMSPEIWQNKISYRSDQYSLAAAYVELRRGRPLYLASSVAEIQQQHIQGTPDLDPLGPAEQKVLRKALAGESHQRFRTCSAFVRALSRVVRSDGSSSFSRRRIITALLVTGLLVLGLVAYRLWLH